MKTAIDLPRPSIADQVQPASRPSTLRLGIVVSSVAALVAVVLNSLTDVPTPLIVAAVVIIGFSLSWRSSGHHQEHDTP